MSTPYNPADYRDRLFPEGRPACRACGERPVYLKGLCGTCFADEGERIRVTERQHAHARRRSEAVGL